MGLCQDLSGEKGLAAKSKKCWSLENWFADYPPFWNWPSSPVCWLQLPMPVSPSCLSGISACYFRTFRSLDELSIFQVGQATFKYGRAVESETQELPPRCRHAHTFRILSWNSVSQPPHFFQHIVAQVRPSIWHFENSGPLLRNPRYSERGNSPNPFERMFSSVMPFLHEFEHTKLMTSLIINLSLAVFYRQSLLWEGLNKPQGDPDSSSSSHYILCPPWPVSSAWFFCEASSSNFRGRLRPRQSLRTICFRMFVVDFCS